MEPGKNKLVQLLADPDVLIGTNHLERGLRPIPMSRSNWLSCWTEVGAVHVGIIQSLISTCRLDGVGPYTYLGDELQRVGVHPAERVAKLTLRRWKMHFADHPPAFRYRLNRNNVAVFWLLPSQGDSA